MSRPGLLAGTIVLLAGCATSPWGEAGIDEERTFWSPYERVHAAALSVVRELAPDSHRVHPDRGTVHAEGEIGRCGEHAHCARGVAGPTRLWTRLRIDFTRHRTSTEIEIFVDFELLECREAARSDCRRAGAPSTGELEDEIVRRIRSRLGPGSRASAAGTRATRATCSACAPGVPSVHACV